MDLATIGFKADTGGIYKATKGLDDLSKQGAKTDKAMSGAGASIGRSFAGVAAAVGGLVSAAAAMQKLISVSREFDVLNAGLITATGSAEKAGQAFKAIEDFATTTPYSLAQATKAFTQLVNLGLTPSEAALTSYGNTAAAMGKDLSQMVEAVADATVGEFERLKEFGIKARAEGDNVSFTFRGMTTTVKKSADEIEGYLMSLGSNEFAGAMANRMNTLDGAISNLSDSWDGLFRTISSQGAGDAITSGIRMATDAIGELTDSIASGQLAGYIDALGAKFSGWGRDIASVLDFVGGLFADAGNYWYLDMSESARLIIGAFKNIPENIRAFIQVATVELSAFVDGVAVYAKAIASYLDITESVVNIEAEFERISAARESSIASILNERQAAVESFNSQITAADGLRTKYDELNGSVDTTVDRLEQYKAVVTDSAKSTAGLSKELSKLDDAALDYFDALEELDQIEKDRISRKEEAIEAMIEPFEEAEKSVEQYATISEKAAERIESAFSDAWVNAFDGFESVVDGMKNAFKRMLAEMAHMSLTKPIMISLGMGGMLPSAASASGLGGASSGAGLLGGLGGGLISAGGAIGGAFGGGLAAGGGLLANGSIGAMFSGAGSLFGSGNIMAGLGMSMPLIAGAVLAAMGVNKLTGGGLFGTSFKTDSQSLGLSLGGGDVSGMITTNESRKKSLFRGTKRRTSTSEFDASAIDEAFDAISSALSESAQMFGITGADEIIKGFSAAANINIKDKSESEIQAAIAEWVDTTTGALVNAVFGDSLDGLQKEGEGVIDTVNRLSMNMGAVQAISKTLGLGFELTGKSAMTASTNIVELAGGLDALSTLTGQYYSAFYSESEKQSLLATQLADSFSALNITMPTTREGFRGLVDGLDLTTESGQAAFAALMQLVPGMDQYLSAIEAQAQASSAATQAAQKEAEAKAKALESQGLDLQLRLYDALGKSSEALALRRQIELASTDETLRVTLLSIYAAQDAAQAQKDLAAAQSVASESAQRLASQRQSLELDLLDATGRGAEALAIRRQLELAAMDESLRGLQQNIWTAQDAAQAQEQLAEAQQAAADAARSAAENAFGKLQESANAEKSRLQSALDARLSTISSERQALEQQRDSVLAGYEQSGQAIDDYVGKLRGISDVVSGFIAEASGTVNPFQRLGQIFAEFKGGLIPDSSELGSVLGSIQSADSSGFASATDQARAIAIAMNQAQAIGNLAASSAGGAQSQYDLLQQQSANAREYYATELAKLDEAKALAESQHAEQVALIDKQLADAQKQINVLLGVDDRLLSMSDALAEFYAALNAANSPQSVAAGSVAAAIEVATKAEQLITEQVAESVIESAIEQVAAIEKVESAIVDLGQTLIDKMRPDDAIWLPPSQSVQTTLGSESDSEMKGLLKNILAASKANAEHASKSASMLQEMTIGGIDVRVEA